MRIEIPIPNVIDPEGDVIGKSFKNSQNPQLALYESIKFDETVQHDVPIVQSDTLVEGVNAKIGSSLILMKWTDLTTGLSMTHQAAVKIVPPDKWQKAFLQGKIRSDGVSGGRVDEQLYRVDTEEKEVVVDNCVDAAQNLAATEAFKLEEEPTYQGV